MATRLVLSRSALSLACSSGNLHANCSSVMPYAVPWPSERGGGYTRRWLHKAVVTHKVVVTQRGFTRCLHEAVVTLSIGFKEARTCGRPWRPAALCTAVHADAVCVARR